MAEHRADWRYDATADRWVLTAGVHVWISPIDPSMIDADLGDPTADGQALDALVHYTARLARLVPPEEHTSEIVADIERLWYAQLALIESLRTAIIELSGPDDGIRAPEGM